MRYLASILASVFLMAFVFSGQAVRAQEDVGRLLKQLEEHSDRFSKSLNQGLDSSPVNGTNTEDEINGYVKQFEDSTDRLKKNYDKGQDNRVAVQEVLGRAKSINTFLKRYKLNPTVSTDWRTVKDDLNRLAKAHKVRLGF
jgi:hypothetical protein